MHRQCSLPRGRKKAPLGKEMLGSHGFSPPQFTVKLGPHILSASSQRSLWEASKIRWGHRGRVSAMALVAFEEEEERAELPLFPHAVRCPRARLGLQGALELPGCGPNKPLFIIKQQSVVFSYHSRQ